MRLELLSSEVAVQVWTGSPGFREVPRASAWSRGERALPFHRPGKHPGAESRGEGRGRKGPHLRGLWLILGIWAFILRGEKPGHLTPSRVVSSALCRDSSGCCAGNGQSAGEKGRRGTWSLIQESRGG